MNSNFIKTKFKENPITALNLIEVFFLFFTGYTIKDTFLKTSTSFSLFKTAFFSLNSLTVVFRIFIVISPIVMIVIIFIPKFDKFKSLLFKILTGLGTVGIIMHIYILKKYQNLLTVANDSFYSPDKTMHLGFAVYLTLIIYILQAIYIFFLYGKSYDEDKTIDVNRNTIPEKKSTDKEDE